MDMVWVHFCALDLIQCKHVSKTCHKSTLCQVLCTWILDPILGIYYIRECKNLGEITSDAMSKNFLNFIRNFLKNIQKKSITHFSTILYYYYFNFGKIISKPTLFLPHNQMDERQFLPKKSQKSHLLSFHEENSIIKNILWRIRHVFIVFLKIIFIRV